MAADRTWWDLAAALFPTSRPMTREERRAFDAVHYPDSEMEPITVTDDPPTPLEILNALSVAQLSVPGARHAEVLGYLWSQHAFPTTPEGGIR